MCCFSGQVSNVSATSIFARGTAGGRQLLVYAMTVAAPGDVAMVLPLPVPRSTREDAVRFIDLSGYPEFFAHLRAGFPEPPVSRGFGPISGGMPQTMKLVVHDVGAFEASFVPTLADFDRLDPRFRLPPQTWDALPGYRDHGFAVFKLKGFTPGAPAKPIHPMAFEFPRRDPRTLFFPTVHVHDGAVHEIARFDHTLYCQADAVRVEDAWRRSDRAAAVFMRGDSRGIIDPSAHCHRLQLHGALPNRDTLLTVG
jgi:hypothetical protein